VDRETNHDGALGLCRGDAGQSYTACGDTTEQWAYVNYAGDEWGYVPSACVTWAS
jgi:hypothetical protein